MTFLLILWQLKYLLSYVLETFKENYRGFQINFQKLTESYKNIMNVLSLLSIESCSRSFYLFLDQKLLRSSL